MRGDAVLTTPFAPVPPVVVSPDRSATPPPVARKSTAPGGANGKASPRGKVTRRCSADHGSERQGRREHRRRVSVGTDPGRGSGSLLERRHRRPQLHQVRRPDHGRAGRDHGVRVGGRRTPRCGVRLRHRRPQLRQVHASDRRHPRRQHRVRPSERRPSRARPQRRAAARSLNPST